jgi:aspartyl-tRNA synthetase
MNGTEELRLEYRYLDPPPGDAEEHHPARDPFRPQDPPRTRFVEVETPMLTRSTPEGARDFLVPSRVHRGQFYALPQSPQLFKQLLMISGFEKYFQIARCFRDEDLRADRQFEFTQIDVEISFPTEEDVFDAVEAFLHDGFAAAGIEARRPFTRLTFHEAMDKYGTDRPDLRYDLPLTDLSALCSGSGFAPFEKALSSGGSIRGLRVPGGASASRKKIDEMAALAKEHGAGGVVSVKKEAALSSPAGKHLPEGMLDRLAEAAKLETGDLLLIVADKPKAVFGALAALRAAAAREAGLVDESLYAFCWVTDSPFGDEDSKTSYPMNHPSPPRARRTLARPESDPASVRARAYDVVVQRVGARLRLDPDPPRRRPGAGLPAPRDLAGGRAAALRVPARRAGSGAPARRIAPAPTGSARSPPRRRPSATSSRFPRRPRARPDDEGAFRRRRGPAPRPRIETSRKP